MAGSGTAERAEDFWAITADRSAAVGRHVTAAKPASCSIRVSSLVDQHLPGVECISNTEYSAAASGPVLVAFMCTSWSTRNPPGGSAAEEAVSSERTLSSSQSCSRPHYGGTRTSGRQIWLVGASERMSAWSVSGARNRQGGSGLAAQGSGNLITHCDDRHAIFVTTSG